MIPLIVAGVIVLFILVALWKTVRVIPQARAGVVERLGRYSRTLTPGLTLVSRSSIASSRCSTCASRRSRSSRSR